MLNFQFSSLNIAALVGGGQAAPQGKGDGQSGSDQFSSLLGMVDDAGAAAAAPRAANDPGEKEKPNDPAAVAADAPVPVRADHVRPKENAHDAAARPDVGRERGARPLLKAARPADKNAVKTPAVANNAAADSTGKTDAMTLRDKLQEKIADRADALSGLMSMLAALLAKAGGVATQVAVTAETIVQASGAAAPDTQTQAQDPQAVFADTHALLLQIAKLLQAAQAQNAPLSQEQLAQLDALNAGLATELDALKNILGRAGDVLPVEQSALFADTLSDHADDKDALKGDIARIKDLLQSFKAGDHPAAKVGEHSARPVAQTPDISFAAGGAHPAAAKANDNVAPVAVAPALAPTVAPQTTDTPVGQAFSASLVAAVETGTSGGGADRNVPGNSGQQAGQGGGQLSAATGVSASQANTASVAANTSFSSILAREAREPVAQQVVFHVKNALQDGSSRIHIQLNPAELGKLDIKLQVEASGKTGITIIADQQSTLDLLQKDAAGLQKALADAGLKTDSGSLSFNLRGGQQEQGNGSHAASTYRRFQPEEEIIPADVVTRSYVVNLPEGLDIKI